MSELELLERKEYLCSITIIEARNIINLGGGSANPFVKVRCADQIQQTQKKFEVNSALWNQTLTFTGIKMNQYELETFEMNIELYCANAVFIDEQIGQYSIGLSTLYRNSNHEFYKTWISVFNRDNPNKIMGYLLISCYIVGPNERPPIHSQDEVFDPDEEQPDSDEDDDAIKKKIESIKRAQGIVPVLIPGMINKKYQLTITIAQADNLPKCDEINKYFVSARAFGCVLITTPKSTQNSAKWHQKILIPIFYPVLNDKITMRIWHKSKVQQNVYIANIPEHPQQLDNFNISTLLAQEGRMAVRWINLYGTEPDKRSDKTKGKKEGTSYLGRVMIAFSILPADRPQLMVQQANIMREPRTQKYQLWVDVYSLTGCDFVDESSAVNIQISIGGIGKQKNKDERKFPLKYSQKHQCFRYKEVKVEEIQGFSFPIDPSQIPDIFIDVYTNTTFKKDVRIAYLRLQAQNCLSIKPKPTWYRLSSPYNNTNGLSPGMLLANVQFLKFNDEEGAVNYERVQKEKSGAIKYNFFVNILQGFEIATSLPMEKLDTQVMIKIGELELNTDFKSGRYPIWNYINDKEVMLDKELTFEPDICITLRNNKKTKFFGGLDIGSFYVPLNSITKKSNKPQFFNLINQEGQFQGQILANFYLKVYYRDPKTRKQKNYVDPVLRQIREDYKQIHQMIFNVDIDISIFGIRNLILKAHSPRIYIRLTDNSQPEKVIEVDKEVQDALKEKNQSIETWNPNFGAIHSFKNVSLQAEPLCWPFIEIQVEDKKRQDALIYSFSGCESSFTTISLIDYANSIIENDLDIEFCKAQLKRNQDRLFIIQPQIQPLVYLKNTGVNIENLNFNSLNKINNLGPDAESPEAGNQNQLKKSMMPNGTYVEELNQDKQNEDIKKKKINLFRDLLRGTIAQKDKLDLSDILFDDKPKNGNDDQKFDLGGDQNDNQSEEMDDFLAGAAKKQNKANNDQDNGIIVQHNNIDEISVFKKHKIKEQEERERRCEEKRLLIKAYQKNIQKLPQDKDLQSNKTKLKVKIVQTQDEILDIKDEEMNDEKFWGLMALDDEPQFDYGRDILKDQIYENIIKLPYKLIPLFTKTDWFQGENKPIYQLQGLLRSGNPSGAIIKSNIRMKESADEDANFEEEEETQQPTDDKKDEKKGESGNKEKYEIILDRMTEIWEKFQFDIFKQPYLNKLNNDRQLYKVRIYLISAQNLTATGTIIDLKSRLAGFNALSTANPYPVISIADQEKENEKEKFIECDLNPKFFRFYELDAQFPEDWKLEIAIWDKGLFPQLIGRTYIDLEDRVFSNLLYINKYTSDIEFKESDIMLNELKNKRGKKSDEEKKRIQQLTAKKKEFKELINELKKVEQLFVPVEYRELNHPSKNQAQGIVELWVEVLTQEDAPKVPIAKMLEMKKEVYEIRLIIWETKDVALVAGGKVSIKVKVTFDPTGWPEDMVVKETDVHMSSKTGWGIFNWRMKFDLTVPCDFPRLKFTILHSGAFSDESIGESTLNLKRTASKVQKEQFVEVPKSYLNFTHPSKPGEDRGVLLFSMTILPKEDANAEPVGESWDEPNENPFLKKPTAGRSLGDLLGGMGFDFNFDFAWNPFGKFLPWILGIAILGGLLTLAVYLKMLGL